MKSLDLIEELNKILIDSNKQADIVYELIGEIDKERSDFEHDLLNQYQQLKAKNKREKTEELFELLAERHNRKYEYKELAILKELYNTQGIKNAFNNAINKLRKLNQEIETPIYYKRAKKYKGQTIVVTDKEII